MSFIKQIVDKIEEVTGLTPVFKGGNRRNPIEYNVSRLSDRNYRMELDLNGLNLLDLLELEDKIIPEVCNFGDTNPLINGSVVQGGGGSFTKDNIITKVLYLDIVDYKTSIEPPPRPSGEIKIRVNGNYDVSTYASADVNVAGGDYPFYEGEYEVTPAKREIVLPTKDTVLEEDVTIFQIPYSSVQNPQGGYTVTIGIE